MASRSSQSDEIVVSRAKFVGQNFTFNSRSHIDMKSDVGHELPLSYFKPNGNCKSSG